MQAVSLDTKWIETAQFFGEVESVIKEALGVYFTGQCWQRIHKAAARIDAYEQQYGCDYKTFRQAIQTDEAFLMGIETQNPLWEEDAMEWAYWLEEHQTWRNRLETISQR